MPDPSGRAAPRPGVLLIAVLLACLWPSASVSAADGQTRVLVLYSTRPDAQIAIIGERDLPRILNDDLEHVSTDLLIRILGSLGYRVRVSVTRADTAA